jgi:hypothetical protein
VGEVVSAEGVIARGKWENDKLQGKHIIINALNDPMLFFSEHDSQHNITPRPSLVSDCCDIAFNGKLHFFP